MSLTTLLLKLSLYDTDGESWIQADDQLLTNRLVLAFKEAPGDANNCRSQEYSYIWARGDRALAQQFLGN